MRESESERERDRERKREKKELSISAGDSGRQAGQCDGSRWVTCKGGTRQAGRAGCE